MAKICINGGHTKSGLGYGSVGYLVESNETRKITNELVRLLKAKGHQITNATIDKSSNYLKDVVAVANRSKCDLFISIHLNASNGKGYGSEIYTWKGEKLQEAVNILKCFNCLGFRNRGIKDGSELYVIKNTTMKAMLIEVCFVDNKADAEIYKKIGVKKIAEIIANSI